MVVARRNSALLLVLGIGALILALAIASTGTVAAFDRDTTMDFGRSLYNADNDHPRGIWSDGTTMWVADNSDGKLYAYDLEDKTRVPAKDFNSLKAAGNEDPAGIWSDGDTMWVADIEDDKVFAYLTGSRAWDPAQDFDTLLAAGNEDPAGIWSDGETMWVADFEDDKIYAYNLATKARDSGKDFDTLTGAGNDDPRGIWSDGATMWVADIEDDKIYAYNLATKARDSAREFETLEDAGNNLPRGIWSDGATMWVVDESVYQYGILAYNMPEGTAPVQSTDPVADPADFDRDTAMEFGRRLYNADNDHPRGIWSDWTTMWVVDNSDNKIYAYDLATKARVSAKEFDGLTAAGNEDPAGLWSDGATMWVADTEDDKIFAYFTGSRAWDSARDFDTLTAAGNNVPAGLWSDGATMWVADFEDAKIYSYNLATKARDSSKEFDTLAAAGNNDPRGIWSDGATMWVADIEDDKIYAYDSATKDRIPARDFETLQNAGNNLPRGIWSDGATMWVVDESVYQYGIVAYNMPEETTPVGRTNPVADPADFDRDTAMEFGLAYRTSYNGRGIWSDWATMWVVDDADDKIYAYNLATKARVAAKEFDGLTAAGNNDPAGLWSDGDIMWVADVEDDKIYAYLTGSRAWDSAQDFNTLLAARNRDPAGLWSDGETMWVADVEDDKIYAYNLATKARDSAKDFDTLEAAGNNDPWGIWSDGETMWVADIEDDKIYAYDAATEVRVPARDFETLQEAGNHASTGIWSDGATMWAGDYQDYKLYAYNMPGETAPVDRPNPVADPAAFDRDTGMEFGLAYRTNYRARGIWSDEATMWVADDTDDQIFAYDLATKARVTDKEFDTLTTAGNNGPAGLWSDGATMWVADSIQDKLYAYDLAGKQAVPAQDFDTLLAARNRDPAGLWSDGATMWVADIEDDKIYAYNLATKARDSGKDFDTLEAAGNNDPWGIWSDDATMWVADIEDDKIYAYDAATKARVPARDFETLQLASNLDPTGIWSDGATMWVGDYQDHKLYAYNLPPSLPVTPPGVATIGSVSPGAGSVTVSWSAPSGDASQIIAYDLRYIPTADDDTVDANWTEEEDAWTGSGSLQYVVAGLTGGTQYDVQVRAVNYAGDGPWSATATGTPSLPVTPPGMAAIDSVRPGAGSLTVAWSAPTSDAIGITAYDLRHKPTDSDETVDANWTVEEDVWTTGSPSLQHVLDGLTGGTLYDVQVRAVNSSGDGPWSATATGTPQQLESSATATRSFSPTSVMPGGEVTVTVAVADYGFAGALTETLPEGFAYKPMSSNLEDAQIDVNDQTVKFTLVGVVQSVTYVVTASSTEGPYSFSGTLRDSDHAEVTVGGALIITVGAELTVTVTTAATAPVRLGLAIPVTATFSAPVSGFAVADVTVMHAVVSNFAGSGAVYTFDVTPNAVDNVTVDIAAGAATAGGNGNTAASQLSLGIPYDDDGNGAIGKSEVVTAINDYLFGSGGGTISKTEVVALINLYLFS